ncbi:MAG TPA: hypothetical protein VFR33_10195 [Candidatus Dormibacteraeota bacterium]|nr:hypothetical protein [Candidatus Dormibacteraeota bacterium]
MKRLVRLFVVAAVALGWQAAAVPAEQAHEGVTASPSTSSCQLGNGIQHVIEITFDNVHFFRDNPNVPSDLELMPHLLQFIEQNGTLLSNNHTPLIAHTADDSLTTYTGLYGDRHGMPISNSYQAYNADGTTDPAGSFAYWTDPVFDTATMPNPGHDTNPSMVYAAAPPATTPASPSVETPAPWVPFTRAGCNVGDVSTANMVLENTAVDIPKVFGPSSPESMQLASDPDRFKDAEVADYVGLGVHCPQNGQFCAIASGVKFGDTAPSSTQVPDLLPNEPRGYSGFNALFGHRYIAPQLGAGITSLTRNDYAVTNAAGNLVDLNGNQINGAFLTNHPGFPGFGPINASQTLAYVADLQESGVPVTYGYIADIHGNEHPIGVPQCNGQPSALGSGSACYIAQAQYYDAAFATFFQRLATDGITPANTEFIFSADEGDHEVGANVGRAIQPTPANCDGATVNGFTVTPDVLCTYPAGSFGELSGNLPGLLHSQTADTTPFSMENDSAPQFYVTGNPAPTSAAVRRLEQNVGLLTANNPYVGGTQPIANYLADPTEEAILHMVNADPARTPTFTLFGKPDYFWQNLGPVCSGSCVKQDTRFAYDHGAYAPEINTTWAGFVGPGVAATGLDGPGAADGPNSAGPNSGQGTVPAAGTKGTWVEETDIRPTLIYLTGLKDDYVHDGQVITQILSGGNLSSPRLVALSTCYRQLNSSVGQFGTATLQADTAAIESSSNDDATYTSTVTRLAALESRRDALAQRIKNALNGAAFDRATVPDAGGLNASCNAFIDQAVRMAG